MRTTSGAVSSAGAVAQSAGGRSQAARRARSRAALLESTARALSRAGYGNLNLERVAKDAGYTRGALYHQFEDKNDLLLGVVCWIDEAWQAEVGAAMSRHEDPLGALFAFARGHAVFCRRGIARVAMALRLEFEDRGDHPVSRELERVATSGFKRVGRLINEARRAGSIPAGPPARVLARGFVGAVEGAVIALAGQAPHDETIAVLAAAGVLGVPNPGRA